MQALGVLSLLKKRPTIELQFETRSLKFNGRLGRYRMNGALGKFIPPFQPISLGKGGYCTTTMRRRECSWCCTRLLRTGLLPRRIISSYKR